MPTLGHKNVCGFDVAVDDAFCVGCVKSVGDLDAQRKQSFNLQRSPRNVMLQRHAVEKLHGNKGLPVLVINLVDGTDVRMIQCRRSLRFAAEAGQCLRVLGYFIWQELKGNKASESGVLGLIDHAHTTAAQLVDDAEVRDGLADHGLTDHGLTDHGIAQW